MLLILAKYIPFNVLIVRGCMIIDTEIDPMPYFTFEISDYKLQINHKIDFRLQKIENVFQRKINNTGNGSEVPIIFSPNTSSSKYCAKPTHHFFIFRF